MTEDITLENIDKRIGETLSAVTEFKQANDDNLKKYDALNEEKMQKLTSEITGVMQKQQDLDLQAKRIESLELALKAGAAAAGVEKNEDIEAEYKSAFGDFIRKGKTDGIEAVVSKMEVKDLRVNNNPDGGYWVTPQMLETITTRIFETSPIRSLASVMSTTSDAVEFVIDEDEAQSGGWVTEEQARPDTDTPQIGKKRIETHEQYAQPKATQKIIDDASINVEQWIASKVADILARRENTSFVTGNGVSQPRGFLTYPTWSAAGVYERDAIEQINSGAAGAFTSDGLMDLQNSLIENYQGNAKFLMTRKSFGEIIKLKTSTGEYLFNRDLTKNTNEPFNLLGAPVVFANDMPESGADLLSAAYGDFSRTYQIVDRLGIRTLRDQLTEKPYTKFYTTKRVGGDVLNYQSLKIQKLSV